MKTREQCIHWLKLRRLYGRCLNYNMKAYSNGRWHREFNPFDGVDNFPWDSSPEGGAFWTGFSLKFVSWYLH